MARLPTIPEPAKDPNAMFETVKALKECVELISGQRIGADAPFCRLFKGVIEPGKLGSGVEVTALQNGDFWFNPTAVNKLYAWDNRTRFWMTVA